jgi:hypothetical protein
VSLTYSPDELKEFSDLERPSAIRRWLDARKVPYIMSATGWPKVLRTSILDPGAESQEPPEPQLRLPTKKPRLHAVK